MNEFDQELKKRISHIEEILDHYLPKPEGFQKTVLKAMNTTVKAGGKRLRPMLMEETYKMFGGKEKVIEPFMAAIEMIHTYSLIHDDLPALDNDDYRRGQIADVAHAGRNFVVFAQIFADGLRLGRRLHDDEFCHYVLLLYINPHQPLCSGKRRSPPFSLKTPVCRTAKASPP